MSEVKDSVAASPVIGRKRNSNENAIQRTPHIPYA
jgi:hypothetical protein